MALAAFSAVAFTACSDDDQYTPGDPSEGVYFAGAGQTTLTLLPSETQAVINVYRQGITEAATYKIDIVNENSDLFYLQDEVSFGEGENTAQFIIGYNADDLQSKVEYTIELSLAEGVPVCAYGSGTNTLVMTLEKTGAHCRPLHRSSVRAVATAHGISPLRAVHR